MPHITIEYIILLPALILQIFLFPMTVNWLMNTWVNSRRTLTLQNAATTLGSVVQQIYFSLNHNTMPAENVSYSTGLPPLIENTVYTANATLSAVAYNGPNSNTYLQLTMKLVGTSDSATTGVVLGSNALWQQSTFVSNSVNACINAQKFPNGTILLWFAG